MAGHANMATTSRYIHAKDDPMTRAADTVTEDRQKRLDATVLSLTADAPALGRRATPSRP